MYRSGSFRKPLVMEGAGRRQIRYPSSPRTGSSASSTLSTAMPRLGPRRVVGLSEVMGRGMRKQPTISVPPRDVDDGNAASTHMLKEPPVRVRIPGFSSGSQILQPAEIKSLHVLQAFPHQ